MRKQVEVLEHHADFAPHLVDFLEVGRQFHAVNDDAASLVLFQTIDATDHRRFARSGWAANDDALAAHDLEIDIAQDVKVAVPLVHAGELDGRCRLEPGRLEQ